MRPIELRIVLVRPVPAVGQLVECCAEVINVGRTAPSPAPSSSPPTVASP